MDEVPYSWYTTIFKVTVSASTPVFSRDTISPKGPYSMRIVGTKGNFNSVCIFSIPCWATAPMAYTKTPKVALSQPMLCTHTSTGTSVPSAWAYVHNYHASATASFRWNYPSASWNRRSGPKKRSCRAVTLQICRRHRENIRAILGVVSIRNWQRRVWRRTMSCQFYGIKGQASLAHPCA